ncbi:glutamate racemase [Tepidimicrobium xylanilyticum]|uniref:Glutamate racemase n=1 Tax=Tepidimicrobium xylanilyticum TaxID=1123352 RepID=A0A1H2WDN1_9FIRM|nr:glutamate racemase [Tepidimicrobium xylanilyticum]GMG95280.1 glutamate racemase [Tepidimicrobium xylanilyticum]SDW78374.1 glutamate racemase [Tepidimicrobium xylanilyticum]
MDDRPIGVFDSGIGGLTVLKEIMEQLPGEDIVYFGDTARIPYGTRSKETVIKYFFQSVRFLLTKDIKAIVIACNTASALAMEEAQEAFEIPLLGVIEPGAKAAVSATKNSIIGVIGTEGTINSQSYQRKIRQMLPSAEIIGIPCPLFVSIVEEGWENTDVAYLTAKKYLLELKEHNIDSLVLGCTHYPALRYTINKVLGDNVILVNPAYETAKAAKIMLKEKNLLSNKADGGKCRFYVSDNPEKFKRVGGNMLKKEIASVEKVNIESL